MKNEKGLTLIELIGVIAIFFIVSTLLFGVILNIQKNYQTQNNNNQLAQEANLVVALVKMYHQKGIPYIIEYNSTQKKAFIGPGKEPLVNGSNSIEIITLQQDETIPFNGNTISIDPSLPLFFKVKITNQNNKSMTVDTIISNYQGG